MSPEDSKRSIHPGLLLVWAILLGLIGWGGWTFYRLYQERENARAIDLAASAERARSERLGEWLDERSHYLRDAIFAGRKGSSVSLPEIEDALAHRHGIPVESLRSEVGLGMKSTDLLVMGQGQLLAGKVREAIATATAVQKSEGVDLPHMIGALELEAAGNEELEDWGRARDARARVVQFTREYLEPSKFARAKKDFAFALAGLERFGEAYPVYNEILEKLRDSSPEDELLLADVLDDFARMNFRNHRIGESRPLALESVEIRERLLGKEHPDVASALFTLSCVAGRGENAEEVDRRIVEIDGRTYGEDHPKLMVGLTRLGATMRSAGKPLETIEPLFRRALKIAEARKASDDQVLADILFGLALVLQAEGRGAEAVPFFSRGIEVQEKLEDGTTLESWGQKLIVCGLLFHIQGEYEKALDCYKKALDISWGKRTKNATRRGSLRYLRSEAFGSLGKTREAKAEYALAAELLADVEIKPEDVESLLRPDASTTYPQARASIELDQRMLVAITFMQHRQTGRVPKQEEPLVNAYRETLTKNGKTLAEVDAAIAALKEQAGLE